MTNEFTAVVERDGKWFIAYCAEIPGANGQGRTKEEALESLSAAVALILSEPAVEQRAEADEARPGRRLAA